jgi:hypothetical protein
MRLFKHKLDGNYYRLVTQRESNVNTFLEVDELNIPIVKKREWSHHPQEQIAIMMGFKNLIKL